MNIKFIIIVFVINHCSGHQNDVSPPQIQSKEKLKPPIKPKFVCPNCTTPNDCMLEDPDTSNGFIQCTEDREAYMIPCGPGTVWNNKIKRCDLPINSNCTREYNIVEDTIKANEECVRRIYKQCNYPTTFTEEELENVRKYLNYSFTVLADIKPDKPLCPQIKVRQDWKCLTPQQKTRITNVWKQLYRNGLIHSLAVLHVKTWPAWHKTVEFLPSHRWFINQLELSMQSIDPGITLPYWDPYTYGPQPERSSIWETLGHSGNYSNGYSVSDGIYADIRPNPTVKRHWLDNGTILPWFTQEFITSFLQTAQNYNDFRLSVLGLHFNPHLNIGGYEGQYAVREAPYDILFFMHHLANTEIWGLKWQLKHKSLLTPMSYDFKPNLRFNPIDGRLMTSNIRTDTLTGVPNVTIRELFWVGFGDLCSIPDQLVKPINNIWKGLNDRIPTAVKRIPKWILSKYFPYFNANHFSALYHTLEEVGECNTVCRPIPKPVYMRETEAGRRQYQAFRYDNGLDYGFRIDAIETILKQMWTDLNRSGYCSPYVTTY